MRDISREAEEKLLNYLWPGNVRELENTMHRAVLLAAGDEIGEEAIVLTDPNAVINFDVNLPAMSGGAKPEETPLYGKTVAGAERELIIDTLKHTFGNRTQAANILGISIRTLRNKLKQYEEAGYQVPPASMG